MHKAILPWLFLLPGCLVAQPFNPVEIPLDSLLSWLRPRLQQVNEEADILPLCHVALRRAVAEGETRQVADAYHHLAEWHNCHYYVFPEANDSAIYYDKQSIIAYEEAGQYLDAADMRLYLAEDFLNRGQIDSSLAAAYRALRVIEKLDDEPGMITDAHTHLTLLNSDLGDTTRTLHHLKIAERLLNGREERRIDDYFTFRRLAESAEMVGDYETARRLADTTIYLLEKSIAAGSYQEVIEMPRIYSQSSRLHRLEGNLEQSLVDAKKGLTMISSLGNDSITGEFYFDLGLTYLEMQRYPEAVAALERSAAGELRYLEKRKSSGILAALGRAYFGTGDFRRAAEIRQEAITAAEAEHREVYTSLRLEVADKYESDKKDGTIASQEDRLSEQRRNQWLGGGIALLLALGLIGTVVGLRKNSRKNALLKLRNTENETLLKEIHHRVKNNLEVVSSLLELQSATLVDGDARDAMLAGQSRVASMGLLHQKLYQGTNLASVNMRDYLTELTDGIQETYGTEDQVRMTIDVPADLALDVDTAVPLGLIVNELVTNSLKYAFLGADAGTVEVKMSRVGAGTVLSVSDNGSGKTEGVTTGTGFGTRLVGLLTRQLDGEIREVNSGGLRTEVTF